MKIYSCVLKIFGNTLPEKLYRVTEGIDATIAVKPDHLNPGERHLNTWLIRGFFSGDTNIKEIWGN